MSLDFAAFVFLIIFITAACCRPEESLKKLKSGNERFYRGQMMHAEQTSQRIVETSAAQHPYAVVLTCSDSRVAPEFIFDAGIGDIFTIRNAGGVVDTVVMDSIELAIQVLDIPLIVIMGHTNCGAVKEAIHCRHYGNDNRIFATFQPAIDAVLKQERDIPEDQLAYRVSVINAIASSIYLISNSSIITTGLAAKNLRVVTAMYNIENGIVTWND